VLVLQVGVQFDLVGSDVLGAHGCDGLLHQVDGEVGNTNLARQAHAFGFQQLPHELGDGHLVFRRWPVDQGQVQVIGLELAQAFLEAWDQLAFGEIGDPDLAGDKQLIPWDATVGDSLADICFVLVDLRGVDGAVAQFKAGADGVDHHLALQAKGAEAEGGDFLREDRHQ